MSFTDEYLAQKKKKKKSETTGHSFTDEYSELRSKRLQEEEDDVAPVVTVTKSEDVAPAKKDDERKWFEKGAFEDGYQFGDISKTLLGTLTDTVENLGTGIIGMGEKAIDAMAYIAPIVSQSQYYQNGGGFNLEQDKLFREQNEIAKKEASKFIKKDLYDEEKVARAIISDPAKKYLYIDTEDSVFGEKTDSLLQSGGQLAATIGLQAVGVPWFVTTGVTNFGSEAESALNDDATFEEAGLSSAVSTGAEVLSESLFGIFGKTGLDDLLVKDFARKVSSKIGRSIATIGIKGGAEALEEAFSWAVSKVGQKMSYADEKTWAELYTSEEAVDELIESVVGGFVLGGGITAVDVGKSYSNGVDPASGLTANEEAVVDKVYKDAVAEAEKDGKITEKQKSEIYDKVLEQMEKGYISIETIEEVLGDKSTYDSLAKEAEEFNTLYNTATGQLSKAQQNRLAELEAKNEANPYKDALKASKDQYSKSVFDMVKGDRLSESYNEKARRGQTFEADLSQYDAKQQAVIQKAIDSGILNNTNRTHEFVDVIAKISADKGVSFDFTNNAKLKESGFAVDGKMVNGYVTKDGIAINIDSSKAWQSTVGHEITHVLEGTEMYDALKQTLFDYAKSKGEYDSRMASLTELYKDIKDADVEAELTADLVGDYLFQDSDFINRLSTEHRNVFEKIYDEIKYLCRVVTAGSKEARELEKVKKAFEDTYRASGKQASEESDSDENVQYSLVEDQKTIDFLENQDHLTVYKAMVQIDGKLYPPMASQSYVEEEYTTKKGEKKTRRVRKLKNPSVLGKWQQADERTDIAEKTYDPKKGYSSFDLLKSNGKTTGGVAYNPYEHTSNIVLNDQFAEAYQRPELVTVEYKIPVSELASGYKAQYAKDPVGLTDWKAGGVAQKLQNSHRDVYLTRWSKPVRVLDDAEVAQKYKEILDKEEGVSVPWNVVTPSLRTELEKIGVPIDYSDIKAGSTTRTFEAFMRGEYDNPAKKKAKYSLSDSDGKQLSKEQQEFFKDSKMRDENGNLKVMYHGSQDAGFHVFDAKMSDDDTSFFFVDRNDVASTYSGTSETYEAKTIRTAEDMNNFLAEIGYDHYEAVEKNGKFELLENGDHVAYSDTAQGIYDEFCWYEGVGEGDANYKVYLNLTNPLEVDAKGRPWNKIDAEFSQEVYDKYNSLTADEKAALVDLAEWEDFRIFNSEIQEARGNELESAYKKLEDVNIYDIFSVASDNFSEESLRENSRYYLKTRDYAQRAKEQGYDGVIFKNIVDNGGYSNGSEGASTVAIAFDSNQIKSVANVKPTADPDIRYSVSDSGHADSEFKVMDGGSVAKFSLSTWTPETQTKVRSNLVKAGYDGDQVDKWIKDTNGVASVIAADKDRLDFVAADNQTMLKNNQEYVKTLDASTLCAKRLVYQGTFDAIQHRMPNTMLSSDDLIDLLNMMKEHGVQTPCGVCYVESRRRHLGKFAEEWLSGYDGEYKPNLDEVTTSDGLEALRKSHPQAYQDFVDAMNKKGSSNPKVVQLRTEYRNEIMSLTPAQIRKIEAIGGLRVQSFSDFETPHLLDMMQAVMDMSAKGLSSQAYTKVPNFAWVFGDTGIKINLSLIAEGDGFDSDGNLVFSSVEGMDIDEAMKLRDAYSKNVGTIIVGANDKHILACMADDRIDFIIPFHRSGWGMKELDMMGMSSYTDYTYGQKEHDLATGKGLANLYPPDYWDYNLSGKENAERYLNLCARTGREPKFSQFLVNNGDGSYSLQPDGSTDGYWKTLIDFKMYDNEGNGAAQQKVQPNFNMEEAYRVLNEYEGGANTLPVASDVVEEFVAKYQSREYLAPAMSLSAEGEQSKSGIFSTPAKELRLEQEVAPAIENSVPDVTKNSIAEFPDDLAPMDETAEQERLASLDDADMPPETEPYYGEDDAPVAPRDPFEDRDYKEVGKRNVNAYMYDNPEVKPFFQMQAKAMLGDLQNSVKGERWYNDDLYYESNGEYGFSGTERQTTDDIAYLLDNGYTYAQIEYGLKAIIEDNGAENIAIAKRIEFALNDRLSKGYTDINGVEIPANQDYLNLLAQKQTAEAVESQIPTHTDADAPAEDIAPVAEQPVKEQPKTEQKTEPKVAKVKVNEEVNTKKTFGAKVREAWDNTKKTVNTAVSTFGDKGWVFENLAKKTKNRELEGKYNFLHYSESRAQEYIRDNLMPIVDRVKQTGKTEDVFTYVYHLHNIDRMSLETDENRIKRESLRENFKGLTDKQIENIAMEWIKKGTPDDVQKRIKLAREYIDVSKGKNKPVFGDSVTADVSREAVKKYEAENPEFKELENAIVEYNRQLRKMLVDGNVISQETADMWEKMYPHYVPIRRTGKDGLGVTVPLDTNKTGVNAPIKRATGGDSDIEDLFETMVMRTEQTFKAVAKNSFGVELKNTLGSDAAHEQTTLDKILESFDSHEDLLQDGKNGKSPTFTVFEDGKRVTFDITQEMYDALKPTSENLAKTYKIPNKLSGWHRGLLTDKNPVFLATNAIKDTQDVMINSQHAGKTYMNFPVAIKELASKGQWYKEYMANGGEQNTYFDSESKTFKGEDKGVKKWLNKISEANNFVERIPRLAEYIASRKGGRSIEVSMLDAARVTTNFAAGADVTKFLNRNGFTFLNASVQGAMQQARNIREANTNGLKGWAVLAGKVAGVGLAHTILNHLLWDDDEDYEELSDYVKQNYYIVAKTEDGKFIRIPKGRTMAVIQEAFTQMENLITGDDEVDIGNFAELVIANLAPNNPLENNIIAPIAQAVTNKTWYGEDLVPTRLQDVPEAEQYDESIDWFSKWLGEKTDFSPYKINYLLNQYSGGIGDVFLPMMTPEAESGDDILGKFVAPWKDKFSTDPVMKNQNISDFYDKMDELTVNANSSKATDEDVLKSKYMNSVNSKLAELYQQKREIQNSDKEDAEKYALVKEIQQQIVDLTKEGLDSYEDVSIDGIYATVGDQQFRWYEPGEDSEAEPGWKKLTDSQIEKQDKVTSGLGISPSEYWSNKEEYDFAYEKPEKYAVAKSVGGYSAYKTYSSELYDIKADKDEDGKSINGSRKEKVIDWLNELDADYGEKIILFKSEYNADDTYNEDIVDYLNSRDDISYEEMVTILKELGFKVSSDGTVTWD